MISYFWNMTDPLKTYVKTKMILSYKGNKLIKTNYNQSSCVPSNICLQKQFLAQNTQSEVIQFIYFLNLR